MASDTSTDEILSKCDGVALLEGLPEPVRKEKTYELHKAAFYGDHERVVELLTVAMEDPSEHDVHGNTPLHIAVMLGHKQVVEELLKHGSEVKDKNNLGWTPVDEAISYGDKQTISLLLKTLRDQTTSALVKRRQELIRTLQNLDDFTAELKWEFHTWVPLLSRLLPSDVCRIHKTDSCIRLDSTLGDFTEMRWSRGDLSFIFNGDDTRSSNTLSMVVLDNQTKEYQRMRLLGSEDRHTDLPQHVQSLTSRPIIYANMSTQPITVTRAQSGWFFRVDKSERVGVYETDVYNITNLILISRRRREHLTPEQIQRQDELRKKLHSGNLDEKDLHEEKAEEDEEEDTSIAPPPRTSVSWEDYISAPVGEAPHLGRQMDLKIERKNYKASVCIADECPIQMKKLLDILEVITPYKHFHKLRQFVDLKLPPGFPVKLDIPMFPTVTAIITLQRYETTRSPMSQFLIPRDYKKFVPKKDGNASKKKEEEDDSSREQDGGGDGGASQAAPPTGEGASPS